MGAALIEGPYKKDALVPASPWLDNILPAAPSVNIRQQQDSVTVSWTHVNEKDVFRWVVYYRYGNVWSYVIVNRKDRQFNVGRQSSTKTPLPLQAVSITAVDRTGNESVFVEYAIK